MVSEFLAWWGEQLRSVWPRQGAAERGDAVVATLRDGGALDMVVRRGGRHGGLGTFAPTEAGMAALGTALGSRRPPAELVLPPGSVLEQSVTLPLAAERDLARVLRYEMDRLTPFAADELYWSHAVERRDPARSQVRVRLRLVPRMQVAAALDRLRLAGLRPASIRTAEGPPIRLEDAVARPWQRHGATVLAGACGVLAIAAAAIPFVQQSVAANRVERQIERLDVLATQRAKVGDPLAVLATLTDILPDDTVLTDLSLRQRVITISGQAAAAARLIPALAADPTLRDPAFTAPVTRNETTHSDGFSIRAAAASPDEAVAAAQKSGR